MEQGRRRAAADDVVASDKRVPRLWGLVGNAFVRNVVIVFRTLLGSRAISKSVPSARLQ